MLLKQNGRLALLIAFTVACVTLAAAQRPAPIAASAADSAATIALRVTTTTYSLTSDGLAVPGYAQVDTPGAPQLPVWQTVVEVPLEGDWDLSATVIKNERLTAPTTLPAVPVPVIPDVTNAATAIESGADLTSIAVESRPDPAIYEADTFYPATIAELGSLQQQGDKRYLPVRVYPFQYNPVTNEIRFASDIAVTLTPRAGAASTASTPELLEVNDAAQAVNMAGALRITIGERGVYRLTYAALTGAGVAATDLVPSGLAMTSHGQPVAIEIIGGDDNRFDPGDSILFYGEPLRTRWTKNNVYWLSFGGATGARIATRNAPSAGSAGNQVMRTARIEAQQVYLPRAARDNNEDHGFYESLTPSRPDFMTIVQNYSISTPAVSTTGNATISIMVLGMSQSAYSPDKSLNVSINGQTVGLYQWAGVGDHLITATIPASWLLSGGPNTITLTASLNDLPNAPGLVAFQLAPDWFKVEYPGTTTALDERLYLEVPLGTQTQRVVTGFSGTPGALSRVYDVRTPTTPVRLTNVLRQPGQILFNDQAAASVPPYMVSSEAGLLSPVSIVRDTPSALQSPTNQADYIAVIHPTLRASITPLLDHRQAEGLRVARVDIQDVYDEFNYGLPDQEAIRTFLTYAYNQWNSGGPRPAYVLLVGDSTEDFLAELPNVNPVMNQIPTYFLDIDPVLGETAADNRFVSVNGPDDYLPEMHLGRINASSPISVTNYVNKVLTYEGQTTPAPWQKRVVYVADNDEDGSGYNFTQLQEAIRTNWLPTSYTSLPTIYYDPNGNSGGITTNTEMRTKINEAYNSDALMVQWFGHGSTMRWGSVSFFNDFDVQALNPNDSWPLTVHLSCLNSYYLSSKNYGLNYPSLSEAFTTLAPQRGSIGDIGPTGYHVGSAMTPLSQGIHRSLFQGRQNRLGAVSDEAKFYYYQTSGIWHDVIDTTLVTGDPAVKLRLPDTPSLLHSTLTAAPNPVYPGQDLTYVLMVSNTGTMAATNVVAVLDYDQSQGSILPGHGGVDNGDTITWTEGTMGAGIARTHIARLRVAANATPGAALPGTAEISSTEMPTVHLNANVTIGTGVAPTVTPLTTPTHTPTVTPSPTVTATSTIRKLYLPLVTK